MSGMSYVAQSEAAQTAANDLLQLAAPADAVVRIDKIEVSQNTQTSSETLGVAVRHTVTTAGTGGAITPSRNQAGFAAAGSTVLSNSTSNAVGGTVFVRGGWNVLAPWVWHPTPDERLYISPSGTFLVVLEDAPGASMDVTVVVAFTELGG